MGGIKDLLEQYCFSQDECTILSVLSVCKANAKKSRATSILVLLQQNQSNFLSISEVKIGENKEYKKKRSWLLDEFKSIDVKHNKHEFELEADSRYQYASILLNEKQNFFTMVYKSVQKNLLVPNKELFRNIPDSWKVDSIVNPSNDDSKKRINDDDSSLTVVDFDEHKELAELEVLLEADVESWLPKGSSVISNLIYFNQFFCI